MRILDRAEPHVASLAAMHSPSTAIVDYAAVTRALVADAEACGAAMRLDFEVAGFSGDGPVYPVPDPRYPFLWLHPPDHRRTTELSGRPAPSRTTSRG